MNYTLEQREPGITQISIPTDGQWGTICFAWEDSNVEFTTALAEKGLDAFIALLIADPNTAYTLFCGAE
jgi:hypothetical protein